MDQARNSLTHRAQKSLSEVSVGCMIPSYIITVRSVYRNIILEGFTCNGMIRKIKTHKDGIQKGDGVWTLILGVPGEPVDHLEHKWPKQLLSNLQCYTKQWEFIS